MSRLLRALAVALLGVALLGAHALQLSPDEEKAFHELHQAVGLMEALRTGRCPEAAKALRAHLKEARKRKVDYRELRELIDEVELKSNALFAVRVDEVEALRMRLHAFGENDGFRHEDSWHDEFHKCQR